MPWKYAVTRPTQGRKCLAYLLMGMIGYWFK